MRIVHLKCIKFYDIILRVTFIIFLECPLGFVGKDCEMKCIYPFYGEDCQSMCYCFKDGCHYSRGCLTNEETLSYEQLSMFCMHEITILNETLCISTLELVYNI